jgi:hypothetical protein
MVPFVNTGNGAAPAKRRGRGRPPKPVDPPSDFTPERFRQAMAEADRLDKQTTPANFYVKWRRRGMNELAFKTLRRLQKQGPAEAQLFYRELGRYLAAAGCWTRLSSAGRGIPCYLVAVGGLISTACGSAKPAYNRVT